MQSQELTQEVEAIRLHSGDIVYLVPFPLRYVTGY